MGIRLQLKRPLTDLLLELGVDGVQVVFTVVEQKQHRRRQPGSGDELGADRAPRQ